MKSYQEYIDEIDLPTFINSFGGYEFIPRESSKVENGGYSVFVFKAHSSKNSKDTLVVQRHRNGNKWMYINRHNGLDKGNVVNFLRNRVGGGAKEINNILENFTGGRHQNIKEIKAVHKTNEVITTTSFRELLKPLTTNAASYLEKRGISSDVYKNKQFRRAVCSDKDGNVIFPIRDKDLNIVGLDVKNFRTFTYLGKHTYKNSVKIGNLWISDFQRDKPVDRIVIGEHALDLMSKVEMHPDQYQGNILFVSPCGEFGEETMSMMNHLIRQYKVKSLETAFDNDTAGRKFTALVYGHVELPNADRSVNLSFGYSKGGEKVVLRAVTDDQDRIEGIKKNMQEAFIVGESKITVEGGDKRKQVSLTLNKSEEAGKRIIDFIIKQRGINPEDAILSKPQRKDFNQDLCESKKLHPYLAVRLDHVYYKKIITQLDDKIVTVEKKMSTQTGGEFRESADKLKGLKDKRGFYAGRYEELCLLEVDYNTMKQEQEVTLPKTKGIIYQNNSL